METRGEKRKYARERPVTTYSIVAYDPKTGEYGVAVQSHYFSVGSVVPWVESEVGAVATQASVDPSYGPLGLALMKTGKSASNTLKGLLAADPYQEIRQVAMIDRDGNIAVHTGSRCIPNAGHSKGEHFVVQANLMENERVWPAMKEAFQKSGGDLGDRMLTALEAAEESGGDIRGKQSAALIVVKGESSKRPWNDKKVDLRVDDHAHPLKELRRLLHISKAYSYSREANTLVEETKFVDAQKSYKKAVSLAPKKLEIKFWHAVSLVSAGKLEKARPIFAKVFQKNSKWKEIAFRLQSSGRLPDTAKVKNYLKEINK